MSHDDEAFDEAANEQVTIEIQHSVSHADTATRLWVSHSSPTSPHLRAVQWQARRKLPQRPESCLDEGNDNAKSGRDVHQKFAGSDKRVDWLSKLENQERQKEKIAQRFDKIIMHVEHATKRELTNPSNLNGKLGLNEQ